MTGERRRRENASRLAGLVSLIVLLAYLFTASGTLFGPDGWRRFQVTRNLIEEGRVDISPGPGTPIGQDGKPYAQYAIGHSLAMAPFYLAGKWAARFFPNRRDEVIELFASSANVFFTAATAGCLVALGSALGLGPSLCVGSALLFSFSTLAWQQSKDSFEHPAVALYFTLLFFFLVRFSATRKQIHLWIAGAALGLALLTRYTSVLAYPAVAAFLGCQARQRPPGHRLSAWGGWGASFILATAPFLAFDLWFNYARFGSMWETGQQQLFGNLFSGGSLGEGFWGLTFSWETGLFPFNPALFLLPIGGRLLYQRRRDLLISFAVLAGSFLLFYSSTQRILWTGGWCWGPRFFADLLPLLILLCAPALGRLRVPLIGLLLISTVIQVGSVCVNPNRGFAKRALGIQRHSLHQHGFRESLLCLQSENIAEVARNHLRGQWPRCEKTAALNSLDSFDRSLSFGTFQFWWVYALLCGVSPTAIALYLAGTLLLLAFLIRNLVRQLRLPRQGFP